MEVEASAGALTEVDVADVEAEEVLEDLGLGDGGGMMPGDFGVSV